MPNIKSAIKRVDVIRKKTVENKMIKSRTSSYIKSIKELVKNGNIDDAEKLLPEAVSYISSAASKGVFHKNNASRKISTITSVVATAKRA